MDPKSLDLEEARKWGARVENNNQKIKYIRAEFEGDSWAMAEEILRLRAALAELKS